jgi:nitrite reductase (NADH) small subunit
METWSFDRASTDKTAGRCGNLRVQSGDLSEGGRKIITYGRHRIGVVRAKGRLFAYRNVCPHQGGPICGGLLIHKVEAIIDKEDLPRYAVPGTRCTSCAPGMGGSSTSKPAAAPGTDDTPLRHYETVERGDDVYVIV